MSEFDIERSMQPRPFAVKGAHNCSPQPFTVTEQNMPQINGQDAGPTGFGLMGGPQ